MLGLDPECFEAVDWSNFLVKKKLLLTAEAEWSRIKFPLELNLEMSSAAFSSAGPSRFETRKQEFNNSLTLIGL